MPYINRQLHALGVAKQGLLGTRSTAFWHAVV
jgi:hypothetical protein